MKLVRVNFEKYRSISADTLDLETDTTCLVGINEAGKSNVLLALEKADVEEELTNAEFSRHAPEFGNPGSSPELRLVLEARNDERAELKLLFGQSADIIILTKTVDGYRLDFPEIIFKRSSLHNPSEIVVATPIAPTVSEDVVSVGDHAEIATPTQTTDPENELISEVQTDIRNKIVEQLTQKYLPRFLRFDSVDFDEYYLPADGEVIISQFIANPGNFNPVKNLLQLGGITDFTSLVANDQDQRLLRDKRLNDASQRINQNILRLVWPVESVEVQLSAQADILIIRLKQKDKTSPFKPQERSRGLQWSLAFNIYFLAEAEGALKNSVLLIDEPGIFLHIDAQKKLLEKTFPEINKGGNQIIYTTHLPYLIDSRFPERIRILEKEDEDTLIGNKAWSTGEFGSIPEPVRTALGLRWTEILSLDEKNVVVEGPSDQIIFRTLHAALKKNTRINYLPAFGCKKIPSALSLVNLEGKEGFGLIDADQDLLKLRAVASKASIAPEKLETISNLSGDSSVVTTEDIVPESVFRKAVFNVYKTICDRRGIALEENDLTLKLPRVNHLEAFFTKKFGATSHQFLKMEVAREVAKIIGRSSSKANDPKWIIVQKVIKGIEERLP